MELNETMLGKKVRMIDSEAHELDPDFYPEVGTIGTIVVIDYGVDNEDLGVQWPKGSTSDDDRWFVGEDAIEFVEEDNNESN